MATLAIQPYTYVPTAPRSKKSTATRLKPATEQVSILKKLQHIRSSGTSLSTPRPAVAAAVEVDEGYRPGFRGTGIVYRRRHRANNNRDEIDDDDCDLPTIEELLLAKLQEQGFPAEDRGLDKTGGVEEVALEERGGSVDQSGSAQSDNSGRSPDDPLVLLEDDDSSASEAEVDDGSCAKSTELEASLFDSLENAVDSITPALASSNGRHDIDNFPKTAPRLLLAEQGASTSNSMHARPSRPSSEPLHNGIAAVDLHPRRARSEATTSCSARPKIPLPRWARASDERRAVDPAGNADPVEESERRQRQQEVEQEEDEDIEDTSSKSQQPPSLQGAFARKCRPLCENSVILGMEAIEPPQVDVDLLDLEADSIVPMQLEVWSSPSPDWDMKTIIDQPEVMGLSGKAVRSLRPAERQQLLPNRELSQATSHD